MKISFNFKSLRAVIVLGSMVLAAIVIAYLFHVSPGLSVKDAEKRVRVYLTKEMSQKLIKVNAEYPASAEKERILSELAEELKKVNTVEITAIEVKKLLPDIFIRPHRPTHIVRVEIRTDLQEYPPRYFWLPWSNVDSETSEAVWYFAF